ncbi:Protein of unknown function [Saccharopolyspora shandongensis]|uniref:Uncharacterized protein n=1 Tax=Saccharopolyspora shandongensis TaxID=418495 RepID=A0A1H3TAN3_9PSEU|nr:Protein of unknown function [Saccharopolyspora shandongensis]
MEQRNEALRAKGGIGAGRFVAGDQEQNTLLGAAAVRAATAVFAARFIVKQWLYLTDATGWLAFAKIAMGTLLTALALLVVVWAFRYSTKTPHQTGRTSTMMPPNTTDSAQPTAIDIKCHRGCYPVRQRAC